MTCFPCHPNRINAAYRPGCTMSGILECAECGGPYTTIAGDRQGCISNKKRSIPKRPPP